VVYLLGIDMEYTKFTPWYLVSPPQDGQIPATKKPRLETPIATATAEAATKTASPDVAMALPPPPPHSDTDDDDDANTDSVTDTQSNLKAEGTTAR
jgi:hypothetical protein